MFATDILAALVIVLFVNVSVVALPTNVSVDVGKVNVPEFTIVPIVGDVSVLFVSVCVVSVPTNVVVAFGIVTVLSAVGSSTVSIVSKSSAVAPSNLREF